MELSHIVPWGRSFNEYQEMFCLNTADLNSKVLGCGDGPACFNAELTKAGGNVVSIDPLYQFNTQQIRTRIEQVYPEVISQVSQNKDDFIWKTISNVEELGRIRMQAMETFLIDYEQGKALGRYREASLPILPFKQAEFDLALCSHYLFLYSEQLDQTQHILSIKELCRVAKEVRVYPLLGLDGRKSKHLEPVISSLKARELEISIQAVNYQFQKGAIEMLVIKSVHS
ncbi:MAG: SAM-dependent methyltransferase [Methylococcales bacterium]